MGKFLFKFFLIFVIIVTILLVYLSYFGLETDKFDSLIKNKANEVNRNVQLEFNKTKIHINIKELNLAVKLQNPKILVKEKKIILSKIDLFLPLKSFINSDFLLQKAEIAFFKNDIKDLTKITSIFVPRIINKKIKKIFSEGVMEGEFVIPFNADGSISENYEINAKVLNANININNDFKINNLSTDIKYFSKTKNEKEINFLINKGKLLNLDLQESLIDINFKDGKKIIKSKIKTRGSSKYNEIKIIASLIGFNLNSIENVELTSDLETSLKLSLDNRYKILDKEFKIEGKINNLNLKHKAIKSFEKILPSYRSKIILKDTKISFNQTKNLKLSGLIKFDQQFKDFILRYSGLTDKNFNIGGKINLYDLTLKIPNLNYYKKKNIEADIDFNINSGKSSYDIDRLLYSSNKSKIELDKVSLNKKFEIKDIRNIKVTTFTNNIKNNDFHIGKHETLQNTVFVMGKLLDAEPLLKSLYKTRDEKTLSKDFNNEIKVNLDKTITGTDDNILNISMIASIKKGSYKKLSLKGNFEKKNEIIEMTMYQIDENKRTLQVISDRARPFIKNFDFVKGFEGGKLEYESTISKEDTKSNLLITDFKVSKVPALAQLLTLASLQGIADTLSGEGIRFESFEMKSNSKGNVMNIEDALAMGPAVSILLNGYVDKGKVVSLRGTLVPATKLNSIIASIPVVGDILVGKKTGEGVVGVSFKMKGPPKDIKTTVNPIKTLTPRFIVRAVEKMKKKKREEAK